MKRLIAYDLDGTLVDTRRDIAEAANHMRLKLGLEALPQKEICRGVGMGLRVLIERSLNTQDPKRVDQGMQIYREHYRTHMLDHTQLYPAAREFLTHFQEQHQVVITNKPNPYSKEILAALGVADFFFEIVAGESEYPRKPDPAALLALMKRAEASPQETVLVGDSPIDIETGQRAGVMTACVAHGFVEEEELRTFNPDCLVPDLKALLDVAIRKGW